MLSPEINKCLQLSDLSDKRPELKTPNIKPAINMDCVRVTYQSL